ncbi:hypothetical protein GCM10018966_096700 [Streptomyces yanii]
MRTMCAGLSAWVTGRLSAARSSRFPGRGRTQQLGGNGDTSRLNVGCCPGRSNASARIAAGGVDGQPGGGQADEFLATGDLGRRGERAVVGREQRGAQDRLKLGRWRRTWPPGWAA